MKTVQIENYGVVKIINDDHALTTHRKIVLNKPRNDIRINVCKIKEVFRCFIQIIYKLEILF